MNIISNISAMMALVACCFALHVQSADVALKNNSTIAHTKGYFSSAGVTASSPNSVSVLQGRTVILTDAGRMLYLPDNPPPFVSPQEPIYYMAQDLSVPSVLKLRKKITDKILSDAGNPTNELERVKVLCNWVAENLRHPSFNPTYKNRNCDPKYSTFCHDPVAIIEYTLKFFPIDPKTYPSPWCSFQSSALVGLLHTIGLHGRDLNTQAHVPAEYYSPTFQKWVYKYSGFRGVPLSALEMRDLCLAGMENTLIPVKCGKYPHTTYIDSAPYGFGWPGSPGCKMWSATFDFKEKTNGKPNCLVFGDSDEPAFKNYPRTKRREDIDFPLGLIRVAGAVERNNSAVVTLENCIPYFSHYEKQIQNEEWKILEGHTDICSLKPGLRVGYRGVDKANNPSPVVTVSTDPLEMTPMIKTMADFHAKLRNIPDIAERKISERKIKQYVAPVIYEEDFDGADVNHPFTSQWSHWVRNNHPSRAVEGDEKIVSTIFKSPPYSWRINGRNYFVGMKLADKIDKTALSLNLNCNKYLNFSITLGEDSKNAAVLMLDKTGAVSIYDGKINKSVLIGKYPEKSWFEIKITLYSQDNKVFCTVALDGKQLAEKVAVKGSQKIIKYLWFVLHSDENDTAMYIDDLKIIHGD